MGFRFGRIPINIDGEAILPVAYEHYCLNRVLGMTPLAAFKGAGFKTEGGENIAKLASRLDRITMIQEHIEELRGLVRSTAMAAGVITLIEREKVLSEIIRARVGDFVDEEGNLETGKANLMSPAVEEYDVTDWRNYNEGTEGSRVRKIKLVGKIPAIAELNKMDGTTKPEKQGDVIDKQFNIVVNSTNSRDLIQRVLKGELPAELPLNSLSEPVIEGERVQDGNGDQEEGS